MLVHQLNDLVQVANVPQPLLYVVHNLSWGDPTLPECFKSALQQVHGSAIYCLFHGPMSPPTSPAFQPPVVDFHKARQLLEQQENELQAEQRRREQQQVQRERQIRQEANRLLVQRNLLDLVQKMEDENPALLRKKLVEGEPIVRIIAVQVIAKHRLPLEKDLITRLTDPEPTICQAARQALVHIARGTDFGPVPGASQTGVERSIEKWRNWLDLQEAESPETLAKNAALAAAGKRTAAEPLEIVPLVLASTERTVPASALDQLVQAKGDEQRAALLRLRDGKDDDNTLLLALAIPKLKGEGQHQARSALRDRLTRLPAADLREKLQDDNVEVRCAAALACGRKKAKERIEDLLNLLSDPEMPVVQSARAALTELSGEDFGPPSDAGLRHRADCIAAWRKWWKQQQDKKP